MTLRVDGLPREVNGLVRWGEPKPVADRATVVLADGSRLVSDRPWSPMGLARVTEEQVRLRRGRGWADFPRDRVRWLVLSAEAAGLDLERMPADDDGLRGGVDVVYLAGGDQITGRVASLAADTLTIEVAGESVETPLESVTAIRLSGAEAGPGGPAVLVGLDDGSLLRAESLVVDGESFETVCCGATVVGKAESLTLVQPLGGAVSYLSDLEPVDYRHTPYLDLPWPLATDEGLRGGPITGGGRRAAKGVAMHSAARLIYRHDGSPTHFRADIAVADPVADFVPGGGAIGSVVFRVYLVKDGEFQAAYDSGVVLGGDPAQPIDVDMAGAAALALVVDYADDGDAGDHALWMDARIESAE